MCRVVCVLFFFIRHKKKILVPASLAPPTQHVETVPWTIMSSVITSRTIATTTTPIQQQSSPQQEREDNMTRAHPSLFVETRQSDPLENTSQHSIAAANGHLVINDDVMTGSTEVQLMKHVVLSCSSSSKATPPTSPMGWKSLFPEDPLSPSSPTDANASKSCQKRGRFLVWPVSAVLPSTAESSSPRETSSTTSTDSTS